MRIDKFLKVSRILKRRTVAGRRLQSGQSRRQRQRGQARLPIKDRRRGRTEIFGGEPEIPRARAQRNGKKGRGVLAVRDHRRRGLIMKISAVVPAAAQARARAFPKTNF